MIFTLQRQVFTPTDTIGILYDGNCDWMSWTLEDAIRTHKVPGKTAIPYRTYKLGLRYSPKFSPKYGHDMIHIEDVPGFEYILIHPGNTDEDTSGCILVGNSIYPVKQDGGNTIGESKAAYNRIYKFITEEIEKDDCYLKIISL